MTQLTTRPPSREITSRRRRRSNEVLAVAYIYVVCAVVLFPVVYAMLGAFQTPLSLAQGIQGAFMNAPTLENFERAFAAAPLGRQMVNSIIVTIVETFLVVASALLCSYALVFSKLRGKGVLFGLVMLTMMIPAEGIIVANFLTVTSMGLFDTLVGIFLPTAASAYAIFLFRQSLLTFPMQIFESATLDGVGPLRFLWKFIVPLNVPTIFAVSVTTAIAAYNHYLWPLLITQRPETRTVQIGIKQLSDEAATDVGAVLAGLAFISIPMILLVISGRNFLTKGLTQGSEK